jgi:hypothetical protein
MHSLLLQMSCQMLAAAAAAAATVSGRPCNAESAAACSNVSLQFLSDAAVCVKEGKGIYTLCSS